MANRALHGKLTEEGRDQLAVLMQDIEMSLSSMPPVGRQSFEHLVEVARSAIAFSQKQPPADDTRVI
jgi:hypothetical protein